MNGGTKSTTGREHRLLFGLFATLLIIAAVSASRPNRAWADDAMQTTQQFVDKSLVIMADKQTPISARQQQLRDLLEPRFDFTEMARQALGPHWRDLTPEQRQNFSEVFKSFIESAYLSRIGGYAGQTVSFLKQTSTGDGYAQVFSTINESNKPPTHVNYLLEQKGGGWIVYDVLVENISIIQNYRNQFNRVINQDGFDKLLADLKVKQQQLNASSAG
jgi:phospholipid transport system substrate-binding protein